MQRKHFLLTVAAAAVVVVGAGLALTNIKEKTASTESNFLLFPDLAKKIGDVTELVVTTKGQTADIRRGAGEVWGLTEKGGYPVSTEKVAKAVFGLAEVKAVEARTDRPENYDKLGVGDPAGKDNDAKLVVLKDQAGKDLAALIVGKTPSGESYSNPSGGIYVRKPTEARAWLASGKVPVETDPLRWLEREITRVKKDQMADAVLTGGPDGPIKIVRPDPAKADFVLEGVDPATLDPYAASRTMSVPEFLDLDDVAKADSVKFDGGRQALYRTTDGVDLTFDLAKVDEKWWTKVSIGRPADAPKNEAADALVKAIADRTAGWAYRLNVSDAEPMTRDRAAFMKKEDPTKTQ